jgi:hypothetical protein
MVLMSDLVFDSSHPVMPAIDRMVAVMESEESLTRDSVLV